jgi:DNA-directed RNA polymerase subunit RPC12/RpoP
MNKYNEYITCPHCGNTDEIFFELGDDGYYLCSKCDKEFFVVTDITINYKSYKKEENEKNNTNI